MKLRVVLLEKVASLDKCCFERKIDLPNNNIGPWVTLGHFDAMYTYELPIGSTNILGAICKNNQNISSYNSGDTYFHPLYLLSEHDDTTFWKEGHSKYFLAVVRIHYAESVDPPRELVGQLYRDATEQGCSLFVYETIELSDLVLTVSANHMRGLLEFTLSLRKYDCIGKLYTYCGISYQYIKQAQPLLHDKDEDTSDSIASLSIRFSVTDFKRALEQMKAIQHILGEGTAYSVVGVDDLAVNYQNIPTRKFIFLLRSCFLPGNDTISPLNTAFSDMTTRVGIVAPPANDSFDKDDAGKKVLNATTCDLAAVDKHIRNSDKLRAACRKIVNLDNEIKEFVHKNDCRIQYYYDLSWLRPLSELTKSLLRMCQTSVLDEFVYLMLPGATAFLQNINEQLHKCLIVSENSNSDDANNNQNDFKNNIHKYQRFVEDWAHLMEHIMRIEGQLTPHPDMRPIIYDIPIVMLEYTLAFLDQISQILRSCDTGSRGTNFLLVPRLCERISALELFGANDGMPGLILVRIPLQTLYNPKQVLSALVHETSHFVGETSRNRIFRTTCIIQATAILIAKAVFSTYHSGLINTLIQRLNQVISAVDLETNVKNQLRRIEGIIGSWVESLFENSKPENVLVYSDLIRDALYSDQSDEVFCIPTELMELNDILVPRFQLLLADLCYLFREVYADICMMYLLPLTPEFYIETLVEELSIGIQEQASYEQYATRIYVCLTASGKNVLETINRCRHIDKQNLEQICTEFDKIQKSLQLGMESEDRLIPIGSVDQLKKYAEECYKTLEENFGGDAHRGKARELFNAICDCKDYNQILSTINSYRKKLIS